MSTLVKRRITTTEYHRLEVCHDDILALFGIPIGDGVFDFTIRLRAPGNDRCHNKVNIDSDSSIVVEWKIESTKDDLVDRQRMTL